jgi:exodeoxyribonuclease VII large subunit
LCDYYWITAEIGELKENSFSHHCYLELVEKSALTHQITAKSRAVIWANNYPFIKHYFESQANTTFEQGIKVLVKVSVDFHEVYGFNLTIVEIDPAYTLGEMHLRKEQIIKQLEEDGIFSMNKELPLPLLLTRIAVISSPSAAGYEDFRNHLNESPWADRFAVQLFSATMQGEKTEASVIAALERIHRHIDLFDAVVIIRGGGATSDLHSFDSYPLAANCAQFPLPILTGIGHERDDTIVDMVAHTRLKTPTAAAGFLIDRFADCVGALDDLAQSISAATGNRIAAVQQTIRLLAAKLSVSASNTITKQYARIAQAEAQLRNTSALRLERTAFRIRDFEQFFKLASPEYILQKGYALVLKEGKAVTEAAQLHPGETIELRFADDSKRATIQ